jgi:hypothetical protein
VLWSILLELALHMPVARPSYFVVSSGVADHGLIGNMMMMSSGVAATVV